MENKKIDWNEVLINASISAIQGVMESGKLGQILELDPYAIATQGVKVGKALVEKLKKEIEK